MAMGDDRSVSYSRVVVHPDGSQEITVWANVPEGKWEALILTWLGEPTGTTLLAPEQVGDAREALGSFAVVPGRLSE